MSYVTDETFRAFDANISTALKKAEEHWTMSLSELRNTGIQQQQTIGELSAQTRTLNERQETTDKKTEYL